MALPDAAVFERAGLKAWPGIEVEWDGSWVRRAANGYTKRANSVQSLDPADTDDAAARIAAAADWFRARNIPPVFRVTPLAGPAIVTALDTLGWASIDHSHLYAMELRSIASAPGSTIHDLMDPAFLAAQQQLQDYSDAQLGRLRALLAVVDVPGKGIVQRNAAGDIVASGLMVVSEAIVLTGNVVTHPAQRGRGHAKAMMQSGLAWAHSAGAAIAALNVAADNRAAQALYAGLGYRRLYDYSYRVPGPP